jgi:hypothetical protein
MEERVSHYYRQLLNTYLKILGGIIVFSVLVSFLVWQYINQAHHTIITGFHIVLTLYVIANYILTQVSFKGRLNDLSKVRDLSIRMEEYRSFRHQMDALAGGGFSGVGIYAYQR